MTVEAVSFVAVLVKGLLALSLVLSMFRLIKGPSLCDRVVALDLMTILAVALLATHSIETNNSSYIIIGMVTALIAFLSTLGFSYYVARKGR